MDIETLRRLADVYDNVGLGNNILAYKSLGEILREQDNKCIKFNVTYGIENNCASFDCGTCGVSYFNHK